MTTTINMNGGDMAEMTFPGGLASLFNQHHKVGKDLAIDRDSYQEDEVEQPKVVNEALSNDEPSEDD